MNGVPGFVIPMGPKFDMSGIDGGVCVGVMPLKWGMMFNWFGSILSNLSSPEASTDCLRLGGTLFPVAFCIR